MPLDLGQLVPAFEQQLDRILLAFIEPRRLAVAAVGEVLAQPCGAPAAPD